jgi:tungstate transport system ATP-binding protein
MSMLFQKPALFKTSVYDNVTYGLKFRGIWRHSIDEKVKHALNTVGLLDYAKRIAPTLSGGEAQRVALARAIVTEPEVLLLDEPTANLDPIATEKIEELIAHINREYKTTIIMSTHDRLQGQRLADRIAVMMNGEIGQVGQPHEIFY